MDNDTIADHSEDSAPVSRINNRGVSGVNYDEKCIKDFNCTLLDH